MREWRDYSYRYAILHRKETDNWEFKEIVSILSPKIGERILDVGCGTGEFCHLLKDGYGVSPEGIDINEKALDIASSYYPDIPFRNIEFDKLREETYNAVTMIEVIEHLKDPLDILLSLRESMKNRGRIVVSTPNRLAVMHRIKSAITGRDFLYDPLHVQIFSPKGLASIFERAGFKIDRLYTKPLGIPFLKYLSIDLYWSLRSGDFGTYIFLKARKDS